VLRKLLCRVPSVSPCSNAFSITAGACADLAQDARRHSASLIPLRALDELSRLVPSLPSANWTCPAALAALADHPERGSGQRSATLASLNHLGRFDIASVSPADPPRRR
jgi:hypothetical protein